MKASGNARARLAPLLGAFCVALCAAALALPARAESAGRVLTADGDVLVLRGSQILRLSRGAVVESGDQIHTGADGKTLIVFTDSGLVWIRANSDFIIDEYSYARGGRESAFFSLLKGGVRSVTGLIGRRTRGNFRLRVSVATIGIRGTDFSVVMCQSDCRDSDGGAAATGLYGEVIEGRIAVTPLDDRLLEREFGAGEFFYLADEHSTPAPLLLPPPFLRGKQDEQTRFMEPGVTSIGTSVSSVTSPVVSSVGSTVTAVTPALTPITAPVFSTLTSGVIPIAAPAPSITLPGTIPTTLPSVLPIAPILKR
ncbi:MAG TPA: FecR family protein [Vicinamibacterales bacterium]